MHSRTGTGTTASLTYIMFNFLFLGQEEELNVYRFSDNLYSGFIS
jgi:hypothetical protein